MSKKSKKRLEDALRDTDTLPDSWFGNDEQSQPKDFIQHIESLPEAPSGMSAYDNLKSLERNKDKFIKTIGDKAYTAQIEATKAWIIFKNIYIRKDK